MRPIYPHVLGGGSFVSPIECRAAQPASLMLISQFDQSNVSASVRFAALVIPSVDVFVRVVQLMINRLGYPFKTWGHVRDS